MREKKLIGLQVFLGNKEGIDLRVFFPSACFETDGCGCVLGRLWVGATQRFPIKESENQLSPTRSERRFSFQTGQRGEETNHRRPVGSQEATRLSIVPYISVQSTEEGKNALVLAQSLPLSH